MSPRLILLAYRNLSPAGKARLWLGLTACILAAVLIFGGKPWDVDLTAAKRLKPGDYVKLWTWPAAWLNLFLVGGLFASAGFWALPVRSMPRLPPKVPIPRWFWPMVGGAAVFLAICAWPRLGQSLWHDEASRTKSTMVGTFSEKDDGTFKFKKIKWSDALYDSRLPNHVLQSALSKASNDIWRQLQRPGDLPFSEAALRVPSFLAGLSGVVLLALLLARLGSPLAGVLAAWILALHPWYLRYASEARGYIVVMALLPLLLIALFRAMETAKVRWWIVFGLCQTAMLYAYVTAVYIPLVLNLGALLLMLAWKKHGLDPLRTASHWLVANLLSASLFILLFLPNVPQLLAYIRSEKGQGLGNKLDHLWNQNFLSHLVAGVPWTNSHLTQSNFVELLNQWSASSTFFVSGMALMSALLLFGFYRAVALGAAASLSAVVFVLPPLLSFAETKLRGGFIYEWYLVYAVPGAVALIAIALAFLAGRARSRMGVFTSACFLVLAVGSYAAWTQPQRSLLMTESLQPYREAVLATRPSLDPNAPGQEMILTAFFHAGPLVYDPRIVRCHKVSDIRGLIERAEKESKQLYFNLGYLDTTRFEHPSKYRLIEKSGLFEEVQTWQGFEPSLGMQVFRYVPGSGRGFDFSVYPDDIRPEQGWSYY